MSTNSAIDEAKLNEFMGKALGDMGAALNAALVLLGDELGFYKAMAGAGPMTAEQLAEKTGTFPRYVREWLAAQAASGYVSYDAASDTFTLPPEQALALAEEGSPVFIPGAFQIIRSVMLDEPVVRDAFKSGKGVGWHEHSPGLFQGTERFFRPGYAAHLTSEWIPALDGVAEKLHRGALVADVGCGHDASTIGRIFYAASTMICTPASRAQEIGLALGAQAGEARLREVVTRGGFSRFRRATETPFNITLEARI